MKHDDLKSIMNRLRAKMMRGFALGQMVEERRQPRTTINTTCEDEELPSAAYDTDAGYNDARTSYDGTPR